jgi:hypothetical protein
VPLGLGVLPPELLPVAHPADRSITSTANAPTGTRVRIRCLYNARRTNIEITRIVRASGRIFSRIRRAGRNESTAEVRDVVVIIKEAVEFAGTDTAGHAAPLGKPEQVKEYEIAPTSVIVKVAAEPADTLCELGEALKDDGFPLETLRTVLPPAWSTSASGGPNGATKM